MTKTKTQNNIFTEQVYFFALLAVLGSLFALYVYFVSASIVHVVVRKEVSTQITQVYSDISELESNYISMQHSMSNDIATMQGFTPTEEKIFIDRTRGTLVLSSTNN